jgi:hypothetical protein
MLQKYHKQKQIAYADCQQSEKTMDHIMSAYPILAQHQYIKTQVTVCAHQNFILCKEIGVKLPINTGISIKINIKKA